VKWDATQYLQLQQRVEGVIRGSGGFENKQIEMRKGVEDVTNEPLTAAIEHEVDQDETESARDLDEYAYNEGSESQRAEEAQAEASPAAPPKSEEKQTPPPPQPPKGCQKPEPPRKTSAPKEPPLPQGLTEEEETNVKNARLARKAFPKEYKQALEEMNMIDDGKDLPPAAAAMVVDKINRYLDALESQASR